MANNLILNQSFPSVGLSSFTYTAAAAGVYNVQVKSLAPEALATGAGAGSATSGYGSGAGGGGEGFVAGDQGLGKGGVGQGFGATNGYQQPPAYTSVPSSGPAVSSSLSIVVNVNGSPVYTSTGYTVTQSAQQFKVPLSLSLNDVVTVVPSSSAASDNALNGVKLVVILGQGQ